jgi:hypothetical protein
MTTRNLPGVGSPGGSQDPLAEGGIGKSTLADTRSRRMDLLVSRRPETAAVDLAAALGSRLQAWRWLRATLRALDGDR